MKTVIYSRVSTDVQDNANQLSRLRELHPTAEVFQETASGAKSRPVLQSVLASLQKGDVLVVAALDRLGRKTSEVLLLIEDLERRGVILKSIREGVDYSTIAGRLVTQILCSVAEMERRMIGERTRVALQAKKKAGVKLGPTVKYGPDTVKRVHALRSAGMTHLQIRAQTGISTGKINAIIHAETAGN